MANTEASTRSSCTPKLSPTPSCPSGSLNHDPAISVLMPVFNVERYVGEAICSLLRQTFSNIRVIVVDDGSTDATSEVVNEAAQRDKRIELHRLERNTGIAAARNFALQFCRAPYIACLDGDDVAMETRLEKQLAFLQSHPDVAIVGCAALTIDSDGGSLGLSSPLPYSQEAVKRTMLLSTPSSQSWLARREVYDRLGGYRSIPGAEDYDFLLRAISAGFTVQNVPERLMKIRLREGNTADTVGLRQRKAHHYVVKMYRTRAMTGSDHFSPAELESALRASSLANAAHNLSTRLTKAAFEKRKRLQRYGLLALSAMVSPWQARYYFDRLRTRLALKRH